MYFSKKDELKAQLGTLIYVDHVGRSSANFIPTAEGYRPDLIACIFQRMNCCTKY